MREACKQLYLKKIFGGTLSSGEDLQLQEFTSTAVGEQFARNSDELKQLLGQVAVVKAKPVDQEEMTSRFESLVRTSANQAQRRLIWGVIGMVALWLLLNVTMFAQFGWSELTGAVLAGTALIGGAAAAMIYRQNRKILNEDQLFEYMRASHTQMASLPNRIATVLLIVGAIGFAGYVCYRILGLQGFVTYCFAFALLLLMGKYIQLRERKLDQQAWDWWEGTIH